MIAVNSIATMKAYTAATVGMQTIDILVWRVIAAMTGPCLILSMCGAAMANDALSLSACTHNDIPGSLECGTFSVFEDNDVHVGRKIEIEVMIARATDAAIPPRTDPLFFITGGPGLSAIDVAPTIVERYRSLRRDRDIVFVNQRGAGGKHSLSCKAQIKSSEYGECANELSKRFDLTKYTTTAAARDLEAVRKTLDYSLINLAAVSYGTRVAQEYLRLFGSRVRAAVLVAAFPPWENPTENIAANAQAALDRALADCAADNACNAAFPSLSDSLDQFLHGPAVEPLGPAILNKDTTGSDDAMGNRDFITRSILYSLYDTRLTAMLPLAISKAMQGDASTLVRIDDMFGGATGGGLATGLWASVICAEGYPLLDFRVAQENSRGTFLGDSRVRESIEICANWPTSTVSDEFWSPIASDVPVLIINGELDPITPPRMGQAVADQFKNSQLIVGRHVAHLTGVAWEPCVGQFVTNFIRDPDNESLDTSCIDEVLRPPFEMPQ